MIWISPRAVAAAGIVMALGFGCKETDPGFGAPPACSDPSKCMAQPIGGGTSGVGAATGGSGGAAAGTLQGSVGIFVDAAFQEVMPYNGAATITATNAVGGQAQTDYSDATTGFTLLNLAQGAQWVFVKDDTNTGSIFSTYSVQTVPTTGATLPVVGVPLMTTIAGSLPTAISLVQKDAQLILSFQRSGLPLMGVTVTTGIGGVVAYDKGPGVYSNQATATGAAGFILILNAPVSAGPVSITVSDGVTSFPLNGIVIGPGAATIAGFSL